ncbi:DUF3006 domain-containing protein [Marasmitruncus massiliensis]|uniref:DUF3006 domain-containing protein n=1 Tax=Marasmitruncus massiliensis TaxID=1944642 RepID=UPI000C7CE756|nr:DUF3006 domain-containing protein [Marasmitruncus massiliensis]
MSYIIDRFEGEFAICEDETGVMHDIKKTLLPANAVVGDCFEEINGAYVLDPQETVRRRETIRSKLESLWEE